MDVGLVSAAASRYLPGSLRKQTALPPGLRFWNQEGLPGQEQSGPWEAGSPGLANQGTPPHRVGMFPTRGPFGTPSPDPTASRGLLQPEHRMHFGLELCLFPVGL